MQHMAIKAEAKNSAFDLAPVEARHWINGEFVRTGALANSVSPATGEVIGTFPQGGAQEAQAAIDAAVAAFADESWTNDYLRRSAALSHLADAYAGRLDDLVTMLCREIGKIPYEAKFEASLILRALRFAAGLATQNFGRVLDPRPGQQSMCIRQPVGVAGLIIPWNGPAYLCIRALAPALAAGCTAVVKMPHQAAQIATLHAEIIGSVAEIPRGAVNMFIESGSDGARKLVDSPEVRVVSYTGSTKTERLIAQAAANTLKRVGLELGGKTPHLIFDTADIEAALPVLEKSSTVFCGQFCMAGSRILVQRSIADRVKKELSERLGKVRPGRYDDPSSDMGPLIDKAAVARVDGMVEDAIRGGAKVLVRGGPVVAPELEKGAFFRPTLLEVSDSSLPIVQNEVFGPVQTIQVFDTEDEAVKLANDTQYGLSACIWSRDVDQPMRVARRLEAGLISINGWAAVAVEFEEGGFKASGLGRLGGVASLEDFVEYKQITQTYGGAAH
jgi:betaine-aldehyde dehydrogenase